MKKNLKNKAIKYFKLFCIISIMILIAFSQIVNTKSGNTTTGNKLSPKDLWIMFIYICGMILIPVIVYFVSKLKKEKY